MQTGALELEEVDVIFHCYVLCLLLPTTCYVLSLEQCNEKMDTHTHQLKPPLARLIQNGFTGEARKTGFSRLLVHFNPGLQNGFALQCLDLRKIDKAKADISRAKEALRLLPC